MAGQLKRVAITGMGAVTGLGHDLKSTWDGIIQGKSGISTIQTPLLGETPIMMAGEVKDFKMNPELLSEKEATKFDRFIHFALTAAGEALQDAGVYQNNQINWPYSAYRVGCLLGVGMGGFPIIETTAQTYLEKGHRRVSPFFIPSIIPNMAPGLITIRFGAKGLNYNIASACASSAHAISAAAFEILSGRQDMVITGGCESVLTSLTIAGFNNMKALSKRSDDPTKASRPFDKDRDGFVMGEGAGVLILEDLDKARARGATIYAEVVGHGASSDAYHITAPHPEGEGAIQCMLNSLESAGLKAQDIGYINAHGTSTPLGDIAETKAVKKTFGEHAKKLCVSSTKSMTGHLLGGAGGVESIFCAMALYKGVLPPTINLDNADPECDLDYVANRAREVQVEYALNNSFGFGGTNSCLILKHYQGK